MGFVFNGYSDKYKRCTTCYRGKVKVVIEGKLKKLKCPDCKGKGKVRGHS